MSTSSHLLFANVCCLPNKQTEGKKNVDLFRPCPRKNGDLHTSMIVDKIGASRIKEKHRISRPFFWVTAGGEPTKGQKIQNQNFLPSTSKGEFVEKVGTRGLHELSGRGGDFSSPFPSKSFFSAFCIFFALDLASTFSQHKLDRKHLLHMHRVSSDQKATTYSKRGNRTNVACSQTLYFLFKVRLEGVIKYNGLRARRCF